MAVHARRVTVMPIDIRLAFRIQGDHYQWRITPEDAAQYERHHKRSEGGATYNFLDYEQVLTDIIGKQCHTENHSISHRI